MGKMKLVATRDDVLREMAEKVVGWGEWVGRCLSMSAEQE